MDVTIFKWEGDDLLQGTEPHESFVKPCDAYKIGICVPTTANNPWRFTQDLAMSVASLPDIWNIGLKRPEPISIKLYFNTGSRLHEMRNELATQAIKDGCTHIMFIDNDMSFDMRAIPLLLSYDLPIIGANCITKTFPGKPTARDYNREQVFTGPDDEGPMQVMQTGTAFLLVNADVFLDMGMPFFDQPYLPDVNYSLGEDVYFCRMAMERANIPVFICHTVSKMVKHIGEYFYCHEMTWDYKQLERAEDPELHALYRGCNKHLEAQNGH